MFDIISGNLFPFHSLNAPVNEQPLKDSLIMAEMFTHLSDIYFRSRVTWIFLSGVLIEIIVRFLKESRFRLGLQLFFFHYFWKQTKYNTLEFWILWWNQWIEGRRSWFLHEGKPSFILQCEPNERNAFSAVQWTEGHHQFCLLLLPRLHGL